MRTRYIRLGIYVNAIPASRRCWLAIATVRKEGNGAKRMGMQRSMQRPQSARSSSRARASHGCDFVVGRDGIELREGERANAKLLNTP